MIAQSLAHTLIVDDDRAIRNTLRDLLSDEGYPVAEASDGLQALPILRNNPHPLVVLLDAMMPRMSGMELLNVVEADPELRQRRAFLLITANAHLLAADFRAQLKRMAIPIVPKPFETDHLLQLIEDAAERLESH
ncbi:MAG TPA: response regulator [Ktedonobacterales bacterium]